MIQAVEIEVVGRHPLIVPIDSMLRAIADHAAGQPPAADVTQRERDREAFLLRICSLRLVARMHNMNLPACLVALQHGPGFAKLVGDVHAIRSQASPRKVSGGPGELVTVVIVFARNPMSSPPIETAHLFRKNDLRLESALQRYEAEGLNPTCSVIQMLAADFATCPSLNVVPAAPAAESVAGKARAT